MNKPTGRKRAYMLRNISRAKLEMHGIEAQITAAWAGPRSGRLHPRVYWQKRERMRQLGRKIANLRRGLEGKSTFVRHDKPDPVKVRENMNWLSEVNDRYEKRDHWKGF